MRPDGRRRTVLVAGGTRGIGRAIGLAFGRAGDRVVLTHRWGSADPAELDAAFEAAGATAPEVVEADVADPADTARLLERVGSVDVLVSNVCVVGRGDGTLSSRTLRRSLDYSAWPLLRYVEAMREAFGVPPRYVVATSSDGPDHFYPGYDYVAASKAVLEALCRRLAARHPEMRVNALRSRQVDTAGYREMFGPGLRDAVGRFATFDVSPGEVADAAVALCSGDLDGLSGEVVTVDRGAAPLDNLLTLAPTLLGVEGPWAPEGLGGCEGARRPGVLWVDAGVAPGAADLGRPLEVVDAAGARELAPERVPDCVVVGCDWTTRADDDVEPAELLPALMDRAGAEGGHPRYGVRVDRGADPPSPGEALGRSLDRYWGSWRLATGARLNGVRYTDPRHHGAAVAAVRAILSGKLDGVRGQVLRVGRGGVG